MLKAIQKAIAGSYSKSKDLWVPTEKGHIIESHAQSNAKSNSRKQHKEQRRWGAQRKRPYYLSMARLGPGGSEFQPSPPSHAPR